MFLLFSVVQQPTLMDATAPVSDRVLAPVPTPVVENFSAEQLRAHQVGPQSFLFRAPVSFRSLGLWWEDGSEVFQGAEASIFGQKGALSGPYPIVLAPDLNGVAEGFAGKKQVSALVHSAKGGQAGLLLQMLPAQIPSTLSIVWIPLQSQSLAPAMPAASAVATRALAAPSTYGSSLANLSKPPVYDRSSWGASPPVCGPSYCTTTHVAMHHTASAAEYGSQSWAECAANVQATQTYHMLTRGWCDIGYNYLICPHGDIFEGRAGGDDVRGAHDGFNCGSMGVAMMGYFHPPYSQSLNPAMQDAYVALTAWKCDQQGIDPLGSSWYAGYGGVQTNLYGHRDVSATACPGDLAYAELPQLRQRVDQIVQGGGGTTLILDNTAASYTGTWTTSSSAPDKYGSDYQWASTGVAPAQARWSPNLSQAGNYEISFWWPAGSNRNPNTVMGLQLHGRLYTTTVNQQLQGGQWNVLGVVALPVGQTTLGLSNQGPLGYVVVADALRLVLQ